MDKNINPEELARLKIDKQLEESGWDIVARDEYVPDLAQAVKEGLMAGSTESDYLFFVDGKAIAVLEAKREENELGIEVAEQAEYYATHPVKWNGFWYDNFIPLVYLANGKKILFKNLLDPKSEYEEITKMHSPKKMLSLIGKTSKYGKLPRIERKGLRDCQYNAEVNFEASLRKGNKKSLAVLATGSGKTYFACLATYRLLNYTDVDRVLFLVDRNNLAKQTESEFNTFDRTEGQKTFSSLYSVSRLKSNDDIKSTVVISTIQKLFAVMTGNNLIDDDNDEQEDYFKNYVNEPEVDLGTNITLDKDHFKFIIIDECHRSIYGKWQSVLRYFSDAIVLGLTATPTEEAEAFFNKNIIEKYTYEDSVIDGVNVPFRVYDIITEVSSQGGEITAGKEIVEQKKKGDGESSTFIPPVNITYSKQELDRSVINKNQIEKVLEEYRDSIYTDLYPDRDAKWEYIPKTLIFAKSDKHADEIVNAVNNVFKSKFPDECVPNGFVQKITYSAGDSTALIRDFRANKNFRIAVTVTLVSTGTDIRPLEVVMFMADVKSDVLYTQMKGRGCRTINDDKLREVTPNAKYKECFYIVDAVGVTSEEKHIPRINSKKEKKLSLKDLLEHLSHGDVSDDNLWLLKDYCSTITNRYIDNPLFERHLQEFIDEFDYSLISLAEEINQAFENETLPEFKNASEDNKERMKLISKLIENSNAKKKMMELKNGYIVYAPDEPDVLINKGFSIESARSFIENFEKCLIDHKDTIEALRIIYNSEQKLITNSMLLDLRDMLLSENGQYIPYVIWKNYKRIDTDGKVDELDTKHNVNALTNLIQIARYVYKKSNKLISLYGLLSQRFSLYVGSNNHSLSDIQIQIMSQIANYIAGDGAITAKDLNESDTELWKKGINNFGSIIFGQEIQMLSKYIMGVTQ